MKTGTWQNLFFIKRLQGFAYFIWGCAAGERRDLQARVKSTIISPQPTLLPQQSPCLIYTSSGAAQKVA
jgi:hypothetical protein